MTLVRVQAICADGEVESVHPASGTLVHRPQEVDHVVEELCLCGSTELSNQLVVPRLLSDLTGGMKGTTVCP